MAPMRVRCGSWIAFVASLIACFVALLLAPHAGESQDSPGVKRALLIGINKYKSVPRLQGSLNDIETMRQILITRWGFSDKQITMVTDEAATRNGILAALEQLVKEAGPND